MLTPTLSIAIRVATEAHDGQLDKGGRPYILHPLRVMQRLASEGHWIDVLAVAVLHDVIEDCGPEWHLARLRSEGLPLDVLRSVQALTHLPGESYDSYLDRVLDDAMARRVKRADVLDNLDPIRLHQLPEEDRQRLTLKYHRALARLEEYA